MVQIVLPSALHNMLYLNSSLNIVYKTIGIIITKKNNQNIIEYSSDPRIYETTYMLY